MRRKKPATTAETDRKPTKTAGKAVLGKGVTVEVITGAVVTTFGISIAGVGVGVTETTTNSDWFTFCEAILVLNIRKAASRIIKKSITKISTSFPLSKIILTGRLT